jgi:hypothetical protein
VHVADALERREISRSDVSVSRGGLVVDGTGTMTVPGEGRP